MSADLVAIIFNSTSKKVCSMVIPELGDGLGDDHILRLQKNPPQNCTVAIIQKADLPDFRLVSGIAIANKQQNLGLAMPGICALVDKSGAVQNIVLGDPVHVPSFNGMTLVENTVGATKGDTYDGANFKREYAIAAADGNIAALQTVTLPTPPVLRAGQKSILNNNKALSVGSIVAVDAPIAIDAPIDAGVKLGN